jgi:vacuolar-type H+-ATPase subunit I/STV1
MTFFFHLHSGLRYLVLLSGFIALVFFAFAVATKRPFDKVGRILGASYSGFAQLQVLVGIVVLVTRGYFPALIGHIVMMVLGVGAIQGTLSANRRRTPPGYVLPLVGTVLSLLFFAGGILAIRPGLFVSTAF